MATVSIKFRTDRINKNGEAPINFYIRKNGHVTKVKTGIMLKTDQWDDEKKKVKKNHPNSNRINSLLANKFAELNDQVLKYETVKNNLSSKQLSKEIHGEQAPDFFDHAQKLLDSYQDAEKFGTFDLCTSILNKFAKFHGSRKLALTEFTPEYLEKYERHCRKKLNNVTNTVHKDMKFIRRVFNKAVKKRVITAEHHPFMVYEIRAVKTERAFLKDEQLEVLANLELEPGSALDKHRDMFLFAANSGGMRVSDILKLKWKNIDSTHMDFTMRKTQGQLSIKIPARGMEILNKYRPEKPNPDGYVFGMLPEGLDESDKRLLKTKISSATAIINVSLKTIGEKAEFDVDLITHMWRHSWATRALRKGIPIQNVSKILGHSTVRETEVYAHIVNEELDKSMAVFD